MTRIGFVLIITAGVVLLTRSWLPAGTLNAEVDGVRVELRSLPESPRAGQETTYVVRLVDSSGAAVKRAKVTIQGGMADGMTVVAPLRAAPEPGMYRGRMLFIMDGSWNLKLRVVRDGKAFELPLIEQVVR